MLNPILASSALRRMRSARTILILGVYVGVLLLLACVGLGAFLLSDAVTINDMGAGMTTYLILLIAQFALVVLVAPAMTASSIAGERERQTLELLLVTNTGSLSIVFGKLMENFAFLALLIFSSLPVMCLPMILGGVSLVQILTSLLYLLVCAFAAASVGVLCSSFMKNTVGATIVSYILLLIIGAGTLFPIATGIDKRSITDVLYDDALYAALTSEGAMRMLPALLYANPGLALISLIADQTGMLNAAYIGGQGRIYATLLILQKIGYGVLPYLNMIFMTVFALVFVCIAAALVRPRRVRIRRKA